MLKLMLPLTLIFSLTRYVSVDIEIVPLALLLPLTLILMSRRRDILVDTTVQLRVTVGVDVTVDVGVTADTSMLP